jgi:hypothetical protein
MATDRPSATGRRIPDPPRPVGATPSLRPEQLAVIDAALDELARSLLLARLRPAARPATAPESRDGAEGLHPGPSHTSARQQ